MMPPSHRHTHIQTHTHTHTHTHLIHPVQEANELLIVYTTTKTDYSYTIMIRYKFVHSPVTSYTAASCGKTCILGKQDTSVHHTSHMSEYNCTITIVMCFQCTWNAHIRLVFSMLLRKKTMSSVGFFTPVA